MSQYSLVGRRTLLYKPQQNGTAFRTVCCQLRTCCQRWRKNWASQCWLRSTDSLIIFLLLFKVEYNQWKRSWQLYKFIIWLERGAWKDNVGKEAGEWGGKSREEWRGKKRVKTRIFFFFKKWSFFVLHELPSLRAGGETGLWLESAGLPWSAVIEGEEVEGQREPGVTGFVVAYSLLLLLCLLFF